MGILTRTRRTVRSNERDSDLRAAHQAAFHKMLEARHQPSFDLTVHKAIEELIDACEAYTATRRT
jgi:hypothetical protein